MVLNLTSNLNKKWSEKPDACEAPSDYDDLHRDAEDTADTLKSAYPELGKVITSHNDLDEIRQTPELKNFFKQDDVLYTEPKP